MSDALPATGDGYYYDETRLPDGSVLPAWQSLFEMINGLSSDQIARRQRDIARQLRANGLGYHPESSTVDAKRPWNLDLLPLLIDNAAWKSVSEGLNQRARLKQALYQDIYGEQRLLTEGVIPPAMLYSHRGYLRDIVNPDPTPAQESVLPMYGCDLVRSPSGEWLADRDICQFPYGIGYALENRVVLSRVLHHEFKDYRVSRIATSFRQLQNHILANSRAAARCVILSYPPSHPHYFEFAWLAKYLGYTLVEPADLTVRDHNVYIKTVVGLQAVDVILRFIDDSEIDPMIIGSHRQQGVAGLVEAARRGGVQILNPLGTGILDNPAFNSLLPELCTALLGESLKLRSAPTYWLGDTQQRAHALANIDQLNFRHIEANGHTIDPSGLAQSQKADLLLKINLTPASYIAVEPVDHSTAPCIENAQIAQRQISIRTFQITNGSGFETMPGGLCFTKNATADPPPAETDGLPDTYADFHSTDNFTGGKDVWILSNGPVNEDSLLKPFDNAASSMLEDELPSRIAESVFWLGRNAERVEGVLRLLHGILQNLLDEERPAASSLAAPGMQALLRAVTSATGTFPGFTGRGGKKRIANPDSELISLLQDSTRVGTLAHSLTQWQFSASSVNDRLSSEQLRVFERLDNLQSTLSRQQLPANLSSDTDALNQVLVVVDDLLLATSAFTGLVHENITQGAVWQFMMLGRRIERAHQISLTVGAMMTADRDNKRLLEYLLRLFDSVMTYRSRYRSAPDTRLVLNLLLLDEVNPRSLAYQFKRIEELVRVLPGRHTAASNDALNRLAISGLSRVRLADPEELLTPERDVRQNLQRFLKILQQLPSSIANAVTTQYFTHSEIRQELGQSSLPSAELLKAVNDIDHGIDS